MKDLLFSILVTRKISQDFDVYEAMSLLTASIDFLSYQIRVNESQNYQVEPISAQKFGSLWLGQ